jgi:hypothetical protein
MVGAGMFDEMITGLLIMGVVAGILLCFGVWGLIWVLSHLSIAWVS